MKYYQLYTYIAILYIRRMLNFIVNIYSSPRDYK